MNKHHPAPWIKNQSRIEDADGNTIVVMPPDACEGYRQTTLDTIAAAPDLLAACQKARRVIFRCGELMNTPMFRELGELDAAIAKATGSNATPSAIAAGLAAEAHKTP